MQTKKTSIRHIVISGLIILLLIGLLGIILSIQGLARFVAVEYGSPTENLTDFQRIYYPVLLLVYRDDLRQPMNIGQDPIHFDIPYGESSASIAARLAQAGLIANQDAFTLYLVYKGYDTRIQAGKYTIQPGIDSIQAAYALLDATPDYVSFVILPGWRLEEIADSLPTSGLSISPEVFLTYTRNSSYFYKPSGMEDIPSLEGFLFPGEYSLPRSASVGEVAAVFVNRFDEMVTPELRQQYEYQGLSLYQAVILASIVERESMVDEENPRIASVFYNRLGQGMKLDSDPTVQYAAGYQGLTDTWWINPLRWEDLNLESPYNTYIHPGLPPSPICSPGMDALLAVAYPEDTPFFYFQAMCDGSGFHTFSVTYEEHQQQGCP